MRLRADETGRYMELKYQVADAEATSTVYDVELVCKAPLRRCDPARHADFTGAAYAHVGAVLRAMKNAATSAA